MSFKGTSSRDTSFVEQVKFKVVQQSVGRFCSCLKGLSHYKYFADQ